MFRVTADSFSDVVIASTNPHSDAVCSTACTTNIAVQTLINQQQKLALNFVASSEYISWLLSPDSLTTIPTWAHLALATHVKAGCRDVIFWTFVEMSSQSSCPHYWWWSTILLFGFCEMTDSHPLNCFIIDNEIFEDFVAQS